MEHGVIRRKLAATLPDPAQLVPVVERVWKVALARGARDRLALGLEVRRLVCDRRSLTELLELPPDRALLAVLEGPGEALGLLALSAPVLAGMIEVQTMGRVSSGDPPMRKPTRTDAAMVAGFIDRALEELEIGLLEEADLVWAGGFRYASFLDDPRPLGLLLEEAPFRVFQAEVVLADGVKTGDVLLALPADGRGRRPARMAEALPDPALERVFAAAIEQQVMVADCVLDAVLTRLTLPLSAVLSLQPGDLMPLQGAALDRIAFEGIDGRRLADGRLGQNRGMRAVRLTLSAAPQSRDAAAPPALRAVS